ncbi:MAG: hypothetical protein Kow0092_37170 [Deferrisomatales bacterium]
MVRRRSGMLLEGILGTRNRIRVLRVLFRYGALTGREIAREAGLQASAAHFALKSLARSGLVRRAHEGRKVLYELNKAHFLASHVQALFAAEQGVGPHLLGVLRSVCRASANCRVLGVGLSDAGEVVVCVDPPGAVDAHQLHSVVSSLFGLHLAGVVSRPEQVGEGFVFFSSPAEEGAPAAERTGDTPPGPGAPDPPTRMPPPAEGPGPDVPEEA